MLDLQPLLELSFWFDLTPNYLSPAFERVLFILFAACIVAGSAVRIFARSRKKDRDAYTVRFKIGTMLTVMGFVGLLWFFFAYEGVTFLGARFWFIVWVLGCIAWSYLIARFVKVELPKRKQAREDRGKQNKYLPRRAR